MRILSMVVALAAALGGGPAQDPLAGGRLSAGVLVRCAADDSLCAILGQKTARLNRRDPVAEAQAAAAAGDFRLGAVQTFGDPAGGGWDMPGADCRTAMRRELIGKWHAFDDYVTEAEARHTEASIRFIERYNRALLANPAYPDKDVCAVKGRTRARAFTGPVTSYAEAARTRDLKALTALEAAGRTDYAARDKFDRTALAWAVYNGDDDIAEWLLQRTQDTAVSEFRTPLAAHALNTGHAALARALVAAAGHPTGDTQLCETRMYGLPDENKGCTWDGLLLLKGEWDLLADFRARGGVQGYESNLTLNAALERGDLEMAERVALLPAEGLDSWRLNQYLRARAWPIIARLKPGQLDLAARTRAEAGVWDAAVRNRHWAALTFLIDHGADLNLLTPDRLEACRNSAAADDVPALFVCVKEAQDARERFQAALAARDTTAAIAVLRAASDLKEHDKVGLAALTYHTGDPEVMGALVEAGLLLQPNDNAGFQRSPEGVEGQASLRTGGFYDGPLKAEVDRWASEGDHDQALRGEGFPSPVITAMAARDLPMLRAMLRRPIKGLGVFVSLDRVPGAPDMTYYPGDVDTSRLPDRPPADVDAILRIVAPAVVAADGPSGLDSMIFPALAAGWDGLIADWVALGYDFSKAPRPASIIESWAGFNGQCRPSTARLLEEGGLNWRGTYSPEDEPMSIYWKIAATCRDSRTVAALVALGVGDINEVTRYGVTPLDEAERRNRTVMVAALRAAGARTAVEIDPDRTHALKAQTRLGDDPDLMQSEDVI